MSNIDRAEKFASLHKAGEPLIIYNAWDAGSAKVIEEAGAKAIGTGSDSVAAAHGFPDGEVLPMISLLRVARHIVESTDLPVSVDFEGAYAEAPTAVADNVECLLDEGVVGINFEDSHVKGQGLYEVDEHCQRIAAIRSMADKKGVPLFLNARCDVFLRAPDGAAADELAMQATRRAQAYIAAGASGIFVPGLLDLALLKAFCEAVEAPVNAMKVPGGPSQQQLAKAGAARISHGPFPYRQALEGVRRAAAEAFATN